MVFANVIGSIVNDILPSGIIMVLLTVLIFVGILINIYNAVKTYKNETKKIEEEESNQSDPKNNDFTKTNSNMADFEKTVNLDAKTMVNIPSK